MKYAQLIIANKELVFQNKQKDGIAAALMIKNQELVFENNEKEEITNELIATNGNLKKAGLYQKQYIKGLEKIMHIISHRVRQPISQIVGISNLLQSPKNSEHEVKEMVGFVKRSAITLDLFTKQLTKMIKNLIQKSEGKI